MHLPLRLTKIFSQNQVQKDFESTIKIKRKFGWDLRFFDPGIIKLLFSKWGNDR